MNVSTCIEIVTQVLSGVGMLWAAFQSHKSFAAKDAPAMRRWMIYWVIVALGRSVSSMHQHGALLSALVCNALLLQPIGARVCEAAFERAIVPSMQRAEEHIASYLCITAVRAADTVSLLDRKLQTMLLHLYKEDLPNPVREQVVEQLEKSLSKYQAERRRRDKLSFTSTAHRISQRLRVESKETPPFMQSASVNLPPLPNIVCQRASDPSPAYNLFTDAVMVDKDSLSEEEPPVAPVRHVRDLSGSDASMSTEAAERLAKLAPEYLDTRAAGDRALRQRRQRLSYAPPRLSGKPDDDAWI